jgi:hypothetical protein
VAVNSQSTYSKFNMSSIDNLTDASKKALAVHQKNQSINNNNTRTSGVSQNTVSILSNQTMTKSDSKPNQQASLNNVSINPLLGTNNSQGALNVQIISQQAANASG